MITFIAKPIFFRQGLNGKNYPVRLSSRIRGEEIAEYLGETYTLDGTYDKGGIRIHLKPRHLRRVKDGDYVDIIDDFTLIPKLKERPKIKVISYNKPHFKYLKQLLKNELILIPHPHINFENKKRTKNHTIIGGMVGKSAPESYKIFNPIQEALKKAGIEFKECFSYKSRKEMLEFYDQIDFQVIYYDPIRTNHEKYYIYPGKIINAASFGIPTIAQDIIGHSEMKDYYIKATTYDDIVREALKLKNNNYYNKWSKKLTKKAKEYHISKIVKLYKQLK